MIAFGCSGGAETRDEGSRAVEPVAPTAVVTADVLGTGRSAYRKYCVQCHGYYGRGDGTSAAHLEPPPRDHTDAGVMDGISDRIIAETVRLGGFDRGFPGMPAFPMVTDDELVGLVAYVRSLSRPEVEAIDTSGVR